MARATLYGAPPGAAVTDAPATTRSINASPTTTITPACCQETTRRPNRATVDRVPTPGGTDESESDSTPHVALIAPENRSDDDALADRFPWRTGGSSCGPPMLLTEYLPHTYALVEVHARGVRVNLDESDHAIGNNRCISVVTYSGWAKTCSEVNSYTR